MNELYRFKSKNVEYLFLIRDEKEPPPNSEVKLCARDLVLPPWYIRDGLIKRCMAAPINVLAFTQRYHHHAGEKNI